MLGAGLHDRDASQKNLPELDDRPEVKVLTRLFIQG